MKTYRDWIIRCVFIYLISVLCFAIWKEHKKRDIFETTQSKINSEQLRKNPQDWIRPNP